MKPSIITRDSVMTTPPIPYCYGESPRALVSEVEPLMQYYYSILLLSIANGGVIRKFVPDSRFR